MRTYSMKMVFVAFLSRLKVIGGFEVIFASEAEMKVPIPGVSTLSKK